MLPSTWSLRKAAAEAPFPLPGSRICFGKPKSRSSVEQMLYVCSTQLSQGCHFSALNVDFQIQNICVDSFYFDYKFGIFPPLSTFIPWHPGARQPSSALAALPPHPRQSQLSQPPSLGCSSTWGAPSRVPRSCRNGSAPFCFPKGDPSGLPPTLRSMGESVKTDRPGSWPSVCHAERGEGRFG